MTVVTTEAEDVFAFDTGPGNCLINEAMNIFFKKPYDKFILSKYAIDEIILSGGGAKNLCLVDILKDIFSPISINTVDFYGIPSGAKEALCFAILANETLSGNPSNLPKVTGASGNAILGKITLP